MAEYLLADVGSTFTKLCLVETSPPAIRATAMAPTTVQTDINIGFDAARERLGAPTEAVAATLVCSSAAGGLRIVAVGLVPELTTEAARMAALGAGGKVVRAFAYRLTGDDLEALAALRPDAVLLAGGTDGGNTSFILENARKLAARLPQTPVVAAGNRDAVDALREVFAGRADVVFTKNVMPRLDALDLDPAREAIRNVFLSRIAAAKGLTRLRSRARFVMPTPEAVYKAVALLSRGLPGRPGVGELLAVDIGGATTDVYSCATGAPESAATVLKGLPEPFVKRTVEGDIGVRYTLKYLLEHVPPETLAKRHGLDAEAIRQWAGAVQADPGLVPQTDAERAIDTACARAACELAVARHCGALKEVFTPEGRLHIQEGKDLSAVARVIGTGGPLAACEHPERILEPARRAADSTRLLPRNPVFYIDRRYILWAMGLLAEEEPAAALSIMEEEIGGMKNER